MEMWYGKIPVILVLMIYIDRYVEVQDKNIHSFAECRFRIYLASKIQFLKAKYCLLIVWFEIFMILKGKEYKWGKKSRTV